MTKTITVQLYGPDGNNAVVRMPGRRNVGVVVQADTLRSLAVDARGVAERLKVGDLNPGLADEAEALAENLEELVSVLTAELERAGEKSIV